MEIVLLGGSILGGRQQCNDGLVPIKERDCRQSRLMRVGGGLYFWWQALSKIALYGRYGYVQFRVARKDDHHDTNHDQQPIRHPDGFFQKRSWKPLLGVLDGVQSAMAEGAQWFPTRAPEFSQHSEQFTYECVVFRYD